jgi:hypothetical protein
VLRHHRLRNRLPAAGTCSVPRFYGFVTTGDDCCVQAPVVVRSRHIPAVPRPWPNRRGCFRSRRSPRRRAARRSPRMPIVPVRPFHVCRIGPFDPRAAGPPDSPPACLAPPRRDRQLPRGVRDRQTKSGFCHSRRRPPHIGEWQEAAVLPIVFSREDERRSRGVTSGYLCSRAEASWEEGHALCNQERREGGRNLLGRPRSTRIAATAAGAGAGSNRRRYTTELDPRDAAPSTGRST